MTDYTRQAWRRLLGRSLKPGYDGYNGAGVDDRWRDYGAFLADMGPRPSPGHELVRLDRARPFGPGNVEWRENGIVLDGVRRTVTEWAERLGLDEATLYARLRKRWSVEKAFCQDVRGRQPGRHRLSIWVLRVTGKIDGVDYDGKLSSNYVEMRPALRAWRELVSLSLSRGYDCKLELLRMSPGELDWVEIVRFPL